MKVHEYFSKADPAKVGKLLERRFGDGKAAVEEMLAEIPKLINSIGIREELESICITTEADGTTDVFMVDNEGFDFAVAFVPWGIIRELDVEVAKEHPAYGDIDNIAAIILYEMTYHGDEEETTEHRMQLDDLTQEMVDSEFIEIKPGVRVSKQVADAMAADPKLAEMILGMTPEDMKGKGRRIRP